MAGLTTSLAHQLIKQINKNKNKNAPKICRAYHEYH
jgi:hypothetical protein